MLFFDLAAGYFACFAITIVWIFLYVAIGMIFFSCSSSFALYGRPAMILSEYLSPMPGSAASSSLVALFRSTLSGFFAGEATGAGFAFANDAAGATRNDRASAIAAISFRI